MIIEKLENGSFTVYDAHKSADELTYEEMLGLVAQKFMPEQKRCLSWLKTEEQLEYERNRYYEENSAPDNNVNLFEGVIPNLQDLPFYDVNYLRTSYKGRFSFRIPDESEYILTPEDIKADIHKEKQDDTDELVRRHLNVINNSPFIKMKVIIEDFQKLYSGLLRSAGKSNAILPS